MIYDLSPEESRSKSDSEFAFEVSDISDGRVYLLVAVNAVDKSDWIGMIKQIKTYYAQLRSLKKSS